KPRSFVEFEIEILEVFVSQMHLSFEVARREYAPRDRKAVGHKNKFVLKARDLFKMLDDLGNVLVSKRLVCIERIGSLRMMCVRRRLCARTGRPGLGVDHDLAVDQPALSKRCYRKQRSGRKAAGICDEARCTY